MKRFCLVTILLCLIVSSFVVPSFAIDFCKLPYGTSYVPSNSLYFGEKSYGQFYLYADSIDNPVYVFAYQLNAGYGICVFSYIHNAVYHTFYWNNSNSNFRNTYTLQYKYGTDLEFDVYYLNGNDGFQNLNTDVPIYNSLTDGLDYYSSNNGSYTKNAHADEFLANTLISMGVTFSDRTNGLSIASMAWNYIIDDSNFSAVGTRGEYSWDIESAVSYINAQSNNYKNWYNGYRVSYDVTRALYKFIQDNNLSNGHIGSYNISFDYNYSPYMGNTWGGSTDDFKPLPAYRFYENSTYTYVNGEYITDSGIDTLQFGYSPADVRKFISSPPAPVYPSPSDTSGDGTITDNGDGTSDININFPSLDWLADILNGILDFLRSIADNISNLLSKIIDTLERMFSDAFESLTEFGQGIIDWIQTAFEGVSTLGNRYIPSDLWAVILPFIMINIGIALLMFVLRSH